MKNLDKIIENYRALSKSLSVSVLIDSDEVLRIVITDLRQKRNAITNNVKPSFDDVLLYYLGEDDFEKYIINNHNID